MVHIKSEELCDRCEFSVERCMMGQEEGLDRCDGCKLDRMGTCVCDEIANGTPCEFFEEYDDG